MCEFVNLYSIKFNLNQSEEGKFYLILEALRDPSTTKFPT